MALDFTNAPANNAYFLPPAADNRWRYNTTKTQWKSNRGWTLVQRGGAVNTDAPLIRFDLPAGFSHFEIRVRGFNCAVDYPNAVAYCALSIDNGATYLTPYAQTMLYSSTTLLTGYTNSNVVNVQAGTSSLKPGWPSNYTFRVFPGKAGVRRPTFYWNAATFHHPSGGPLISWGGGRCYTAVGTPVATNLALFAIDAGTTRNVQHRGFSIIGISRGP